MNLFKGRINGPQYAQAGMVLAVISVVALLLMVYGVSAHGDNELVAAACLYGIPILLVCICILFAGLSVRREHDSLIRIQSRSTQFASSNNTENPHGPYTVYDSIWAAILGVQPTLVTHSKEYVELHNSAPGILFFTNAKIGEREVRELYRSSATPFTQVLIWALVILGGVLFIYPFFDPYTLPHAEWSFLSSALSFGLLTFLVVLSREQPKRFFKNQILLLLMLGSLISWFVTFWHGVFSFSYEECIELGGVLRGKGSRGLYECIGDEGNVLY